MKWRCAILNIVQYRNRSNVSAGSIYYYFDSKTALTAADIVFSLIITALIQQNYDGSAILEMLRRMLY